MNAPVEMKVVLQDDVNPWLLWVAQHRKEWMRKLIKSTAWYMQQEIQKGIRSGAPGGVAYHARMKKQKTTEVGGLYKARWKQKKRILGGLDKAVKYLYGNDNSATIGWLAEYAAKLGGWMEEGTHPDVSPRMRRMYMAAGIKLGDKQKIDIPARPTFGPMYAYLQSRIPVYFENKVQEYLVNGGPPAKVKR